MILVPWPALICTFGSGIAIGGAIAGGRYVTTLIALAVIGIGAMRLAPWVKERIR